MKVVVFETAAEKAEGLQWKPFVPPDTLYIFPDIKPTTVFHSQNVREPFDLAFLSFDNTVLYKATIQPQKEIAVAPAGTWTAVEARAGWLDHWGFIQGFRVQLPV
jgi:uncharacterized membrane protein (UPF0127 family)